MRAQKNEEKDKQRARMAAKQRGDDTPSSSSSSEEESSESAIPSPESSPRPDVPLPGDVLQLQSRGAIGRPRAKRARTGPAPGPGLSSTHRLVPVRFTRVERRLPFFGLFEGAVTYFVANCSRYRRAARRPPPHSRRYQESVWGIGAPRPRSPGSLPWGSRPGTFPDPQCGAFIPSFYRDIFVMRRLVVSQEPYLGHIGATAGSSAVASVT